jgi:hypothetical protein
MKRKTLIYSCFLLSLVTISQGKTALDASTCETKNPFNEYIGSTNGVDQFTGSASYLVPLIDLKTSGSLTYSVALKYSSNVYMMARTNSETSPTGWVGLGWALGTGRIECEHNGTMTDKDDEYSFVTGEDVISPIYFKKVSDDGGATFYVKYYLKDHPYWKVEKTKNGYFITGWRIIDESGTIYTYGDRGDPNLTGNSCNRNTLCWVDTKFVGAGFDGEPQKYPHTWDLAQISDPQGNWIRFKYAQDNGNVSYNPIATYPGWNPVNATYTRESHIQEIYTNSGNSATFTLAEKTPEEYYDFYEGLDNGKETAQPVYEKKYLKEIQIKNPFSKAPFIQKYNFEYGFLKSTYKLVNGTSAYTTKRLLNKIIATTGKGSTTEMLFTYNTDEIASSKCFGALKSAKNFLGGVMEWDYEKVVLNNVRSRFEFYDPDLKTIEMFGSSGGLLDWRNRVHIKTGQTSDGEDFYTINDPNGVLAGNAKKKCYVLKWQGTKWHLDTFIMILAIKEVTTSYNYFAILGQNTTTPGSVYGGSYIKLYYWNGEEWKEELSIDPTAMGLPAGSFNRVYPLKNAFYLGATNGALFHFTRDNATGIWSFYKIGDNLYELSTEMNEKGIWQVPPDDADFGIGGTTFVPEDLFWLDKFQHGKDFFRAGDNSIRRWNGENWTTYPFNGYGWFDMISNSNISISTGVVSFNIGTNKTRGIFGNGKFSADAFMNCQYESSSDSYRVYAFKFNGVKWESRFNFTDDAGYLYFDKKTDQISLSNNNIIRSKYIFRPRPAYKFKQYNVLSWDGKIWRNTLITGDVSGYEDIPELYSMHIFDDALSTDWSEYFDILKWNSKKWCFGSKVTIGINIYPGLEPEGAHYKNFIMKSYGGGSFQLAENDKKLNYTLWNGSYWTNVLKK